jgi:HlyD family secretion protein
MRCTLVIAAAFLLAACKDSGPQPLLGTTEWDRIELVAESSEPVLAVAAVEGADAKAGDVLVRLDPRRADADLAAAEAELARIDAQLLEQRNGFRSEEIDEARARVAAARARVTANARDLERAKSMRAKGLMPQAEVDRVQQLVDTSRAERAEADAALRLVLTGTRDEQVDQSVAQRDAAVARRDAAALARERIDIRAPADGRIDAVNVEVGDRPMAGAVVVTMLAGAAYVRAWVPESQRATLADGAPATVHVTGIEKPFAAKLRWVRSDPGFTPYYALTGDDASRLSYMAEFALDAEGAKLPAGLPVQLELRAP